MLYTKKTPDLMGPGHFLCRAFCVHPALFL